MTVGTQQVVGREELILDAVLALLSRDGIAGVSMRGVAREAGVALGLMNYHFEDKTALIAAALRRVGDQDAEIVRAEPGLEPVEQLRVALHRIVDPQFLRSEYLGVRLQLWALASVDPLFAAINHETQVRYRDGLVMLIRAARPKLSASKARRLGTDVIVIQNGVWLSALVLDDRKSMDRSIRRTEDIALGRPTPTSRGT